MAIAKYFVSPTDSAHGRQIVNKECKKYATKRWTSRRVDRASETHTEKLTGETDLEAGEFAFNAEKAKCGKSNEGAREHTHTNTHKCDKRYEKGEKKLSAKQPL